MKERAGRATCKECGMLGVNVEKEMRINGIMLVQVTIIEAVA